LLAHCRGDVFREEESGGSTISVFVRRAKIVFSATPRPARDHGYNRDRTLRGDSVSTPVSTPVSIKQSISP